MAARILTKHGFRSMRTLNLIRQAAGDFADALAGEHIVQLRGKLRNPPNPLDDFPLSNTRKFCLIHSTGWADGHDCRGKILRLLRRREARKLSLMEQVVY